MKGFLITYLFPFTFGAASMFLILWSSLYALPSEVFWVYLWSVVSFVKIPITAKLNFLVGVSWFLPTYLGMTQAEIDLFYSPGPIPTKEWIERYTSHRIKVH